MRLRTVESQLYLQQAESQCEQINKEKMSSDLCLVAGESLSNTEKGRAILIMHHNIRNINDICTFSYGETTAKGPQLGLDDKFFQRRTGRVSNNAHWAISTTV